MDLKEQFEKETGNDPWFEDDKTGLMGLTQDYVDWLESKLNNNEVLDLVSKPFICGNCLISEDKCECKKPLDFGMVEEYYDEKRKCWATRLVKD